MRRRDAGMGTAGQPGRVPRQFGKAAVWFRQAAEQGNGHGQFALGYLYDKGIGVAQDDAEAARWYRKSAEQGITVAQNNLGIMYEHGRSVPQDYVRAYLWYDLSVSLPGADRSKAVRKLDEIARKMTARGHGPKCVFLSGKSSLIKDCKPKARSGAPPRSPLLTD